MQERKLHRCSTPVLLMLLLAACQRVESLQRPAADLLNSRSIAQLRIDLDTGKVTSVELVRAFRARIEALDRAGPQLHAIIAFNPDAEQQAAELDRELQQHGARSPMHGIPIVLKDNINSADRMPTTAGSLALANNFAHGDAPIVARLRESGAIILAKTNLSEWANFRSLHSISGWSAVGGLARNPHALDRSACGSSAGTAVAVAALLAPGGIGTETQGSIVCPSSMNGIVGLKPTLGLLSQQGIVPIAHSQDTAGPMARSVTDVAILLSAMLPPSACAADKTACIPNFVKSLSPTALRGKRIGVWRFAADSVPRVDALYNKALQVLSGAGATLIELESPNVAKLEAAGFKVMLVEFKAGINDYLANTPRAVTTRSLEQLIAYNRSTPRELTLFGQEIFELANRTNGLADAAYLQALADSKRLSRTEGLDRILAANQLDLIVAPTTATAWRLDLVNGDTFTGSFDTLPAAAGYPHLTVPMGVIRSLPVGLSFIGPANADALLLSAGFAYEQLARFNVTPAFKSTVDQLP